MNHFTNDAGYKAISSQSTWHFKAAEPPGGHPYGAYFTTLGATDRNLAARLRIPTEKLAFIFTFNKVAGLQPIDGGHGAYIFFSRSDFEAPPDVQEFKGPTGL